MVEKRLFYNSVIGVLKIAYETLFNRACTNVSRLNI